MDIIIREVRKGVMEALNDEKKIAAVFRALGDENRIRILKLLQSGEKCACILLDDLQIAQPTLSHHMKILCDAQLVTGRKVGKWMYYSICPEGADEAVNNLSALTTVNTALECSKTKSCC